MKLQNRSLLVDNLLRVREKRRREEEKGREENHLGSRRRHDRVALIGLDWKELRTHGRDPPRGCTVRLFDPVGKYRWELERL